jgi:antirestriction protein ArdC
MPTLVVVGLAIVFSKEIRVETANTVESKSDSDTVMQKYRVFRLCPVFNIAQSDIDPAKYREKFMPLAGLTDEPNEAAMQFIAGIDHKVQFGSSEAYYSPAVDTIFLPNCNQFVGKSGKRAYPHAQYIAVYCHELIHYSGAENRLNRLTKAKFGSPEYAKEELVSELGSAFLCAEFGIDSEEVQHPAYMQSWLAALQQDAKYIFGVASLSKTACDFLKEKSVA